MLSTTYYTLHTTYYILHTTYYMLYCNIIISYYIRLRNPSRAAEPGRAGLIGQQAAAFRHAHFKHVSAAFCILPKS